MIMGAAKAFKSTGYRPGNFWFSRQSAKSVVD